MSFWKGTQWLGPIWIFSLSSRFFAATEPPRFLISFRQQAGPVQHVQKIGIPADVELICLFELTPRFWKRWVITLWMTVAPIWDLTSSPIRGMFLRENLRPHSGSLAIKTGMQFINATRASQGALGIEPGRLFGADREVIEHDFAPGFFQLPDNIVF